MRQQDQQINDDDPDVVRSEPVPVTGPSQVEPGPADDPGGPSRAEYPEGTADHGPEDALEERGSYDNDLGPGGWPGDRAEARARDEQRGENRLAEERAEDDAVDDDALADRSPEGRTPPSEGGDDPGPGDRGDLADASRAEVGTPNSDRTADGPEFHEPAPLPTTFGAPTVGGAVAASALAGSHRDAREENTVRSGDGPAEDRIDGIDDEPDRDRQATQLDSDHHATRGGGSGDEPERDHHGTREGGEDRSLGAADAAAGQRTDAPAVERRPVDGADSDVSTVVGTSHPVNPDVVSAGNPDAGTGAADQGTVQTGTGPDGELLPGAAPAEPIVAILSPDTVQGFRDRWREVQLRFVDDPPGATADAHRLVEESVEALTAALAEQRDELGGWQRDGATDTEQLRMVVRRHRDFLDRLLGR